MASGCLHVVVILVLMKEFLASSLSVPATEARMGEGEKDCTPQKVGEQGKESFSFMADFLNCLFSN